MIIYITGFARSGTTLLRRMFYSFDGVDVVNRETHITNVEHYSSGVRLYKADRRSPLSNIEILPIESEESALRDLKSRGAKVVNIVRSGKGVCIDKRWLRPEAWLNCIDHYRALQNYVDANVYYADLLQSPDEVQSKLVSVLGLSPKAAFSSYPSFVCPLIRAEEDLPGRPEYELRDLDRAERQHDIWQADVAEDIRARFLRACDEIDQRTLETSGNSASAGFYHSAAIKGA